jgi:4-amino-4-deoxy-L-arabinose transferase-like glycosyltransferase
MRLRRWSALLVLVFLVAFVVRGYGLGFPLYHWDENTDFGNAFYASFHHLAMPAYNHGSFFIYVMMLVWDVYLALNGIQWSTPNVLLAFLREPMPLVIWARGLGVLAGTGTVVAIYFLGRRLYGRVVGLLAAFFLALMFLHVSESHYARSHVLAVFFIVLALYFCARILDEGSTRDYVGAGVSLGLATAAQYSAILTLVALIVAHAARVWRQWRNWRLHRSLLFGLDSSALAFFVVTPYALLDFQNFVGEMKWWLSHELSRTWVSPEGQPVLFFYLREHLGNGMGLALLGVALTGVIYALFRHRWQDGLWLTFIIPLFIADVDHCVSPKRNRASHLVGRNRHRLGLPDMGCNMSPRTHVRAGFEHCADLGAVSALIGLRSHSGAVAVAGVCMGVEWAAELDRTEFADAGVESAHRFLGDCDVVP